jgi:hypothetical protein
MAVGAAPERRLRRAAARVGVRCDRWFGLASLAGDPIAPSAGCQVLIDVRRKTIQKIDCRIHDGRLIILTRDGRVTITDPPPLFDLPQLIPAALRSGTDALVKVAEALGAKTTTDRCG